MATQSIKIICADEVKIHRPKPKRINKKTNLFQYNKKCLYNNRQVKPRNFRKNNNEQKKNNIKNYAYDEKKRNVSFNLDLISLEEIENDFKEFESKNEEIEVKRELLHLLWKADNETNRNDCCRNFQGIRRPQRTFCKNFE
jgi:hypothetical protein